MWVCLECGEIFEEPRLYIDTHGLDTPPYEERWGCPVCGGAYTEAYECGSCGEWINDSYIKVNNERYCSDCYQVYELGDED